MKKRIPCLVLLLSLLLTLAACGAVRTPEEDDERGQSERRRRHEAGSQAAETIPPTVGETDAPIPIVTPSPEPQPYTEPPVTEAPAVTPAPAVKYVDMERFGGGEGEAVEIRGLSEAGETVWTVGASTDYTTELTLIQEIGRWQDRYYFNRAGTVVCLSLADGSTLWENTGFGGASISSVIDERNGNVYLCGWYGPDFFACDREGRTISNYRTVADGFYWPSAMSWNGPDELVIYYHGGAGEDITSPYYVDLTDFSISYSFGYVDLDADSQYWANIFISDFAEQFIREFPKDGGSDAELSSFARLFCKINRHDAIVYDKGFETLSLDTVNELCLRFFGREIHPEEGVQYKNDWGMEWKYENGRFYFPASDGEAYNRFAVVREVLRLNNGDVLLSFDVYELSLEEYWGKGMDGALYRMTPAEAGNLAKTGRIVRVGSGTALTTPIEQNGHDGYLLHKLHIDLD